MQQVQQAQVASQEASQASRLEQQGCQAFGSPQEVEVISSGDEHQKGALQVQSEEREEPFNPTLSGSFGQPMICRFEMCKREIVDGFGLCSPGRWTPAARERLADSVQSGHAREIRGILERFVHEQLGDVKKFAFMLATGKVSCSPFSDEALSSLRRSIAATLGDPAGALEVPERQPFYLYMLAQSLQILGDPDWEILTQGEECYANGVPLGHDRPLPRTPQVFRKRLKTRQLDETPFDPIMSNYVSAELSSEQLEAQFRKDAEQGMMIATTEGAVRQEFGPDQLLIAAMGAIRKPNGDVRPLHDATHGVNLNNRIQIADRLEVPGPADIFEVVARAADSKEVAFCICADIAQAHRRVKIRRVDWPRLGCKATSAAKVVWLNCVGTFGVSSAAILWTRLFGCVGRWVLRVMGPRWNLQIIFVDDLHIVVVGADKFVVLWMIVAAYLAIGTPFSFHKFRGGLVAEFIGYYLSYEIFSAGLSPKRVKWVLEWIESAEKNNWYVTGRGFSEFLRRLNFVARIRPFLAPLFAFNAVLHRGTVARLPAMAFISLRYIKGELRVLEWNAVGEANLACAA